MFQDFLDHDSEVFESKKMLDISYVPTNEDIDKLKEKLKVKKLKYKFEHPLPYRDTEIDHMVNALGPVFRGEGPDNLLLFGMPGTGKTAVTKHVGREIEEANKKYDGCNIKYHMLNCATTNTEYGIFASIGNSFSEKGSKPPIPFTGWPQQKVYETALEIIDSEPRALILVLDEIDKLLYKDFDKGNGILYQLMEMNSQFENDSYVSLIGISNDTGVTEMLDQRVESRLGGEKITFENYDANQLRDILYSRAPLAFKDNTLTDEVIPLSAALAAQRSGDARYALNLLRVSGELTEREGAQRVTRDHVRAAEEKIGKDVVEYSIKALSEQGKYALEASLLTIEKYRDPRKGRPDMGRAFEEYRSVVNESKYGATPVTFRRFSDLVRKNLAGSGIVHTRVVSFGRDGRTSLLSMDEPVKETVKRVLKEVKESRKGR